MARAFDALGAWQVDDRELEGGARMSGSEPVALPRFYAERRDREWFVIDRDGEREPPAPMQHGMAQARDVARMLNAQLEKPRPPVERDPRAE